MVSFRELYSKQNRMDCKVTFQSTSKRSQVHNVRSTVCVRVCILTSLAVSGASALIPLLLRGSEGRITPSSKSLFHLFPITPSSGRGRGGAAEADWLFIHPSPPCSSFPSHSPSLLLFSGVILALFDLKTFLKFHFSFLCFSLLLHEFTLTFLSVLPFSSPSFLSYLIPSNILIE